MTEVIETPFLDDYEKHKQRMKEYQRHRIKTNPDYYAQQKERVKNFLRDKYKNDEDFGKKKSEYSKLRYQEKKEARLLEQKKLKGEVE